LGNRKGNWSVVKTAATMLEVRFSLGDRAHPGVTQKSVHWNCWSGCPSCNPTSSIKAPEDTYNVTHKTHSDQTNYPFLSVLIIFWKQNRKFENCSTYCSTVDRFKNLK